jgi:hypothetical protein
MFQSSRSMLLADAVSVVHRVAATAMAIALLVCLSTHPAAAQATMEYGNVATGAGAAGLGNKVGSALSQGKKPASAAASRKRTAAVDDTEYNPADANRHALEQRAGQDAAKLSFKSVPASAVVRIDGKPVGKTPLLMSLAPGTYQIEMEGPRMEFGKQQLTLGTKETREIELQLSAAPRYPEHITLQ